MSREMQEVREQPAQIKDCDTYIYYKGNYYWREDQLNAMWECVRIMLNELIKFAKRTGLDISIEYAKHDNGPPGMARP